MQKMVSLSLRFCLALSMYLYDFRHKTEVSRSRKIKITKWHFECAHNAENGIAALKIFVLEERAGGGGAFWSV